MLTAADHSLLLDLLALPTAGPLESAGEVRLWEAQEVYAEASGFTVAHHAPADPAVLRWPGVPDAVRGIDLSCQPNLVLRLGPPLPRDRTAMFNVHLDTVAGTEPVSFDGAVFRGRGAIDAKGPAVALLAGIRNAAARDPAIGSEVAVLVQAVSGEEGGAMGVFGTRPLVEAGHVGALNVFCEPTGGRYQPSATAAATAEVRVDGEGAVDDLPGAGHNATVLLGHLAAHLGARLDGACVAGLHTGTAHNRVYGSGSLLVNLPYASAAAGAARVAALEAAVASGLAEFAERFAAAPSMARTAADAAAVTRVLWRKRGLPTLTDTGRGLAELMAAAGIPRGTGSFTCDAIWMSGVRAATAVLGPGDLAANRAHAAGEYAVLAELDAFAGQVSRLLLAFAAAARSPTPVDRTERTSR
ncbi:M20/M25/M40 family metallo-hydrolase [Actinokineospora sp. 24-640]